MKNKIRQEKISDICSKIKNEEYKLDTDYQRNADIWSKKLKYDLIKSILKGDYIPPAILANNEVVDGKQRLSTICSFYNSQWPFKYIKDQQDSDTEKEMELFEKIDGKIYDDLSKDIKQKFSNSCIYVADLGKNDEKNIINLFVRLNKNTIQLNKTEILMSKMDKKNSELIRELSDTNSIQEMSNQKKNDKRFSIKGLLIRAITIDLNINKREKSSVRQLQERTFIKELQNIEQIKSEYLETLTLMKKTIENTSIPVKNFNVIFESLFIFFRENLKSKNSFLKNKSEIQNFITNEFNEYAKKNQMGGGTKYDSLEYIRKRIDFVKEKLNCFLVDNKRQISDEIKCKIWNKERLNNNGVVHCKVCGKKIEKINKAHFDHIIPWTKGGKSEEENIQILCPECNKKKSKN